uniref:Apoptogenic protein 1, mitochondrial n=1 Tax=Acrobeloides nanus TaxID=290746 RepID=A0A914DRZ5_9BILA
MRLDHRFDWVGPPDTISKIRPIKLRAFENETSLEKNYRLSREELNNWNSKFWREHNELFHRRHHEFVTKFKQKNGLTPMDQISANDMSLFYKQFLNERSVIFTEYNKEWYRRNFALIWSALKVNLKRFTRI